MFGMCDILLLRWLIFGVFLVCLVFGNIVGLLGIFGGGGVIGFIGWVFLFFVGLGVLGGGFLFMVFMGMNLYIFVDWLM